jgi:serine/threonine protein kinase
LFGLFLTDPRELGFLCYDLPGYDFIRMLGQGAHSTVYAVMKTGERSVERALKLFTAAEPRDHEHAMLTRLAGLQGMTLCEPTVIPKVNVTEILSQEPLYGILTLPICAPIRPERAGVRLTREHVKELLATLKVAHAHGIVNGDLKPQNILMHVVRNRAVICDWGTAVEGVSLPRSVGTIGYDDFSLRGAPQVPSVASDLKAFVRTVYANFTDQCVPTELPAADAFWRENCGVGTVWAEAFALAQAGNHDALARVLEKQ